MKIGKRVVRGKTSFDIIIGTKYISLNLVWMMCGCDVDNTQILFIFPCKEQINKVSFIPVMK